MLAIKEDMSGWVTLTAMEEQITVSSAMMALPNAGGTVASVITQLTGKILAWFSLRKAKAIYVVHALSTSTATVVPTGSGLVTKETRTSTLT